MSRVVVDSCLHFPNPWKDADDLLSAWKSNMRKRVGVVSISRAHSAPGVNGLQMKRKENYTQHRPPSNGQVLQQRLRATVRRTRSDWALVSHGCCSDPPQRSTQPTSSGLHSACEVFLTSATHTNSCDSARSLQAHLKTQLSSLSASPLAQKYTTCLEMQTRRAFIWLWGNTRALRRSCLIHAEHRIIPFTGRRSLMWSSHPLVVWQSVLQYKINVPVYSFPRSLMPSLVSDHISASYSQMGQTKASEIL